MSLQPPGRARFMGRVTAGATHELRNVLAIIKESAGLIEDLLAMAAQRGAPADPETLQRSVDRITNQVERGAQMLSALNHFAHSPDEERTTVDVGAAVRAATNLSARFVRQQGHRVIAAKGGDEVRTLAGPLDLQVLLFALIDHLAAVLPADSEITVATGVAHGRPTIELDCRRGGNPVDLGVTDDSRRAQLEAVAAPVGARLETLGSCLRVTLPGSC